MATEQATSTVGKGSIHEWAAWIAAIFGLWVLLSPFILTGDVGTGTPMYSNVISGIVVLILSAYVGYSIRGS